MTEILSAVADVQVFLSTIVVFLIGVLSIRSKDKLTSEAAKRILLEKKRKYYGAIFFGMAAATTFVVMKFVETKEALSTFYGVTAAGAAEIETLFVILQTFFMLATQVIVLSIVMEVRRSD